MVTSRSWKFLSIATLAVGLSACSVFDPDMGTGENTPPDEASNQTVGNEQEKLICQATLAVKGVKRPSGVIPDIEELGDGCNPLGTWQLEVAVVNPGGCENLEVPPIYTYEVTADEEGNFHARWLENPADTGAQLRIGKEGAFCKGSFLHEAGNVSITLKPFEQDNGITGQGDVRVAAAQ